MTARHERSREQRLIDLMMEMVMRMHDPAHRKWLKRASREDVAKWATTALRDCGFPTRPMGLSWAVLDEPRP